MSRKILSATGLRKTFGQTSALRGIDIEIASGELLAVTGPSGSGKSTLLHCLAGIITPDAGEVVFDGSRVDDLNSRDRTVLRRREFGFVFQFAELVPELTAVENVALPLLLEGVSRSVALDRSHEWLGQLEVDEVSDRVPPDLSGGERQRVAAARALVHEPQILFADEPTGALDSLAAERLLDVLVALAEGSGLTLVVVTHDVRVAAYAQREVVIRDGSAVNGTRFVVEG